MTPHMHELVQEPQKNGVAGDFGYASVKSGIQLFAIRALRGAAALIDQIRKMRDLDDGRFPGRKRGVGGFKHQPHLHQMIGRRRYQKRVAHRMPEGTRPKERALADVPPEIAFALQFLQGEAKRLAAAAQDGCEIPLRRQPVSGRQTRGGAGPLEYLGGVF